MFTRNISISLLESYRTNDTLDSGRTPAMSGNMCVSYIMTIHLVVVVVVVVVCTLKIVLISAQYLLTSVLVQLTTTDANTFRGHRLTTPKGYILKIKEQ